MRRDGFYSADQGKALHRRPSLHPSRLKGPVGPLEFAELDKHNSGAILSGLNPLSAIQGCEIPSVNLLEVLSCRVELTRTEDSAGGPLQLRSRGRANVCANGRNEFS